MKIKRIIGIIACCVTCNWPNQSLGDTSFIFANYLPGGAIDVPIFDALGNRLSGSSYVSILYGGPSVDALAVAWSEDARSPMAPEPFRDPPLAGYFARAGYVIVGDGSCGGPVWLQVRVWDARLGTTFEDVLQTGQGGYGQSAPFEAVGGLPWTCVTLPTPARPLHGLESFSLVPEPDVRALLGVGGLTMWWVFRRRLRLLPYA